jgi:LPS sulfotransferase NodH
VAIGISVTPFRELSTAVFPIASVETRSRSVGSSPVGAARFEDLYTERRGRYAKDPSGEQFLEALNEYLRPRELELYGDYEVEHPFLFVVGLPRSGTTLLAQLLAYCLDAGYVNNFAARFWLAPVHGLRLAKLIAGDESSVSFESDYARTRSLLDIHEFGYFWRHWLRKDTFDDVVHAREREDEIDWAGLRRTLANVQHELGKPFVAKNMLGAYHMPRLRKELGKVVYVYVERDLLDVCVSILDARRKYYDDPTTWWSYVPPEYPMLEGRDYREQLAGQVHYLGRYLERELREVGEEAVLRVTYEQLARAPADVLDTVAQRFGLTVAHEPPSAFPFRRHDDRGEDKERFAALLARFRAEDP